MHTYNSNAYDQSFVNSRFESIENFEKEINKPQKLDFIYHSPLHSN